LDGLKANNSQKSGALTPIRIRFSEKAGIKLEVSIFTALKLTP
jgi:hypothetical protein